MGFEEQEQVPENAPKNRAPGGQSLFERIFALLLGAGDPEKEKRRQLKQVARDLKKSRYKFFSLRGDQAQPGLAKFFYEIYKEVVVKFSKADYSNTIEFNKTTIDSVDGYQNHEDYYLQLIIVKNQIIKN